jgi:hypothetical protein
MALGLGLTNATKALVMVVVGTGVGLLTAFGFDLTGEQVTGINVFVDALLALWVAISAGDSPALAPNKSAFTGTPE